MKDPTHFRFVNETGMRGEMGFTVDLEKGFIRGRAEGFWSTVQAEAHFSKLRHYIRLIQQRGMPVRVIVEMQECVPQSPEVAEIVARSGTDLYRAGDRVAIVVPNTITRMQMRRVTSGEYHAFVRSLDEAEHFVFAD
jgi:hypothetical protein